MEPRLSCPRCNDWMIPQAERLDVSWAGDGPNAEDLDFAGLLLEIHVCPGCGSTAVRRTPRDPGLPASSAA